MNDNTRNLLKYLKNPKDIWLWLTQDKYLFFLPFAIFFFGFILFPTVYLYVLSFTDVSFSNMGLEAFRGISNFSRVLLDTSFLSTVWFSLKFALVALAIQIPLALALALLLAYVDVKGKNIFLVLFLISFFMSPVILGIMGELTFMADIGIGTYLLNMLIKTFGLGEVSPLKVGNSFWTLVYLNTIRWTPFVFLFLYTSLRSLPERYMEAAEIDGASKFTKLTSIIIPYLTPILGLIGVIRFADAFKTFGLIYIITGGGPGEATMTYSIKVYEMAFVSGDFSLGAAASIIGFFLLLPPLLFVLRHTRRKWQKI